MKILWNEEDIKEYENKIGKKLMSVSETLEHQQKVINRLSRKIQRLKRDNKIIDTMCLAHWNLIDRQQKALRFIKDELSWVNGIEKLEDILGGKQ